MASRPHPVPQNPFQVRINAQASFKRWRPYLGYRAEQVKDFAERFFDEHGIAPSYNQVCEATGIPTRGEVSRIVAGLERRGEVRRDGPTTGTRERTPRMALNR
jgi:SOS-response transcriptional repressor LexA